MTAHTKNTVPMRTIARIRTDFPEKFGVPRQSGVVETLRGKIVFEPAFRNADALRGIDGFSHLWLLWQFSENPQKPWSPTVRPPKLGGNRRMGVFATRSPFRPNPLGLSCVRLEKVDWNTPNGPILVVTGADMTDNTPLFDIKPYVPYTDAHPEACGGFAVPPDAACLQVDFPKELLEKLPEEKRATLIDVLAQDPRPGYRHEDDERVYGFPFAGFEIRFTVRGERLSVCAVEKTGDSGL